MAEARTTTRLVKMAVSAARDAGVVVGGIRVEKGGAVTVLALEAVEPLSSSPERGDSCDEVFG